MVIEKTKLGNRLLNLIETYRNLTNEKDPRRSANQAWQFFHKFFGNFGVLSISLIGLELGCYKIMRLRHQDTISGGEYKDIDFADTNVPVYTGGFIGDVITKGMAGLIPVCQVINDPVLGNQLSPYRNIIAVPIFNEGETTNWVIYFKTDPTPFTKEHIEYWFLIANLIGGVTHTKRIAKELRETISQKERLQAETLYLQEEIKLDHNFEEIIGKSRSLKKVLQKVEQVGCTDTTVLILGESGTGKEILARAIHTTSTRSHRPLVKVNCAALPSNLIESELFGHEKGAFTGAHDRRIGRFELAEKGTIFLDEIGELPLDLQTKFLRVIQEGEFERLGNPKTIKVDTRVIAATNRDLEQGVKDGVFREDLFYRLNVFPIQSPPLRNRKEDIPLLVNHFIAKLVKKTGKKITNVPTKVIDSLTAYDWPGNIRELENIIERAMIISPGNKLSLGDWLPKRVLSSNIQKQVTLEEYEKKYIIEILDSTEWRVSGNRGAAKVLGMKPTTLESRMKKLGIKRRR